MKSISIITHLPFRKKGNQSLIRFVNMFLDKGVAVNLFTSGYDRNGENIIKNDLFSLNYLSDAVIQHKQSDKVTTDYSKISSSDIIMPYVNGGLFGIIRKNASFILNLFYQLKLKKRMIKDFDSILKCSDIIIGYEANMTYLAKSLSLKYKKKYVNKFQGTILAVTERSVIKAILFYPTLFWGLNSSDLCLMVDDGTDGEYWARKKGNSNVRFRPHGVGFEDYEKYVQTENKSNIFTIFNNASGSTWKRPDRIIRALALLNNEDLSRLNFVTTYSGPDLIDFQTFIKELGLENKVEFRHDLDHVDCNTMIRKSSLTIMTNDLSNLGNPILEAIYYNKPFITIDDGSVSRICTVMQGGDYIPLSKDMDNQLSNLISRYINDEKYYEIKSTQLKNHKNVKNLKDEQDDEFSWIVELLKD